MYLLRHLSFHLFDGLPNLLDNRLRVGLSFLPPTFAHVQVSLDDG